MTNLGQPADAVAACTSLTFLSIKSWYSSGVKYGFAPDSTSPRILSAVFQTRRGLIPAEVICSFQTDAALACASFRLDFRAYRHLDLVVGVFLTLKAFLSRRAFLLAERQSSSKKGCRRRTRMVTSLTGAIGSSRPVMTLLNLFERKSTPASVAHGAHNSVSCSWLMKSSLFSRLPATPNLNN